MKLDISLARKMAAINPNITLIAIVPGPLEYGLSRMWQTYSSFYEPEPLQWETVIVKTREEANSLITEILNGK